MMMNAEDPLCFQEKYSQFQLPRRHSSRSSTVPPQTFSGSRSSSPPPDAPPERRRLAASTRSECTRSHVKGGAMTGMGAVLEDVLGRFWWWILEFCGGWWWCVDDVHHDNLITMFLDFTDVLCASKMVGKWVWKRFTDVVGGFTHGEMRWD